MPGFFVPAQPFLSSILWEFKYPAGSTGEIQCRASASVLTTQLFASPKFWLTYYMKTPAATVLIFCEHLANRMQEPEEEYKRCSVKICFPFIPLSFSWQLTLTYLTLFMGILSYWIACLKELVESKWGPIHKSFCLQSIIEQLIIDIPDKANSIPYFWGLSHSLCEK